jgi:hypothetical protein
VTTDELDTSALFAPPLRRPWLTPTLLGFATFALTALAIRSAAERQAPILDSMEIQPFEAAASLAYAWGSVADAAALEHQVLALAERGHGAESSHGAGEPDFETLRKMDADMAKLRLAVLEDAPRSTFEHVCAAATIRCTPTTLEGLITLLKKQRLVAAVANDQR